MIEIRKAAARIATRCVVGSGLVVGGFIRGAESDGGIAERPLASPAVAPGLTMFAPLTPDETGVQTENNYADPKMWGESYQEFLFGAIGTGVAIGDYDGDGRPDIFVVSKTESCRLFRNLGGWKFEDVTQKAGVADDGAAALIWKQGATFADVNNDGRLDLYVCRFNAPNLLYVNQGNGTFKEMAHAYGLDITDACGMASFADYDRDGWLDVYIATNLLDSAKHPNGQRGYLLHNNRDGAGSGRVGVTFTNVTDRAGITGESSSHAATWWDYDNDGWPDLYVANDYGVPDRLYHNNRGVTFTDTIDHVAPHTSFSSMGADVGDVNNDGLIDFLVADMAATSHEKDQRGEADLRGRNVDPPEGSTAAPKFRRNALLLNTDTGICLEASNLAGIAATDWTWSVRFEDLDNDGRLDLYVTNGMNREQNIDVNTRMMHAETTTERIRIMRDSPVLAERNLGFRNLGDLEFKDVSAAWGLDQKGVSFGAAFGDLDGDGDLDLVYSNYQKGAVVLRNDSASGHRVVFDLRGTTSNRFGIGATIRLETAAGIQVRQLWLARGYMSSSEPVVHFGLGEEKIVRRLTVTWPSGNVQTFENLAADQRFTITEPSSAKASEGTPAGPDSSGPVGVEPALRAGLNLRGAQVPPSAQGQFENISTSANFSLPSRDEAFDETALQRLMPIRLNRRGPGLAVGDLTGDGHDSVAVGGTTLQPARILRGNASGRLTEQNVPALAKPGTIDDGPLLIFDANGDGKNDLLITKGGNTLPAGSPEYQPRLLLNDGHGGLQPAPDNALPALAMSAGAVAAADFDHDGRLDLFIGARVLPGQYPFAPVSALLANRGGKFEDVIDAMAPALREAGMVTSALWSDVDGDGWIDLLVTLDWGQVKYFHNNQGKGFEDRTEPAGFASAGTGWWTAIATADFNGDGRPDYVVGNAGLNTPYHADVPHPALLFSGEFKGDGTTQLIEAYYEGDKLYPWRSRRELGASIPSILKRYPRNDFYARATLPEILGAAPLAKAQRFAATELRSGVFLSQKNATYRFEPLPRLAQIAPLQGVVTGDFDGDSYADIYAVQNSYAPAPPVGRFDGGLSQLLRGDGRGHFAPVPVAQSNLVVTGDAKALVMVDLNRDGWPDFLVTRNNLPTLVFRNHGTTGHASLHVQLHGSGGNPDAIGARITLELADGSAQTGEIQAGSGYYSQSTAGCFFGFPERNPPKRLTIRWPAGVTSTHDIASQAPTLEISEPKP